MTQCGLSILGCPSRRERPTYGDETKRECAEQRIRRCGSGRVTEEAEEDPVTAPYPIKDISGDGKVNIVIFGDSIWDDKRGEDGISEQ